jgi:antitoxin component YwqK of YwqJK toxin-antitoxin module
MIQANSKFPTPVKFVKIDFTKNGQKFTSFSVSDKVKNGKSYKYYKFTVWDEHLDLKDGDKVFITEISDVNSYFYNGKIYDCISGKVEISDGEEPQYEDESVPVFHKPDEEVMAFTKDDLYIPQDQNITIPSSDDKPPWDL